MSLKRIAEEAYRGNPKLLEVVLQQLRSQNPNL